MSPPKIMARVLGACLALALAGFLLISAVGAFPTQDGVDFYQFWGIGAARKIELLAHSPYRDAQSYASVLNTLADESPSLKLRRANAGRRKLEPAGTPFLYACFSLLPLDYETAQAGFVALLYAAGLAGTFLLARLRGFTPLASACLALVVANAYAPFALDIIVANVNLLQLAAFAALLHAALRPPGPGSAALEAIAQSLAWVLVVFKPNVALISAAYELQRLLVNGRAPFLAAARVALAAAILAIAAGAWYFGSAMAWPDWLSSARELGNLGVLSAVDRGNQSIAMWLALRTGTPIPALWGVLLGVVLIAAVVGAARAPGQASGDLPRVLRRAFADPFYAMSFGIMLTLAVSPLVWKHYLVLALVPIAWQVRGEGRIGQVGALVAFFLMSLKAELWLYLLGGLDLFDGVRRVAWLALIPGLLASTRARRDAIRDIAERAAQHPTTMSSPS